MTPATLSASNMNRTMSSRETDASRDRVLGALFTVGSSVRRIGVGELRGRLVDMSDEELDRVLAALDREGAVVIDRGMDGTTVRLASPDLIAHNVPESLRDRIIGATWACMMAPYRAARVTDIRARLVDVPQPEFERALAALMIGGELEFARGSDAPSIRVRSARRPAIDFGVGRGVHCTHEHAHEMRALTQQIAHELWMMRGCRPGHDLQDWVDAERMACERIHH